MAEILSGKCKSATCKYLETGICENGHENVNDCENFSNLDLPDESASQDPSLSTSSNQNLSAENDSDKIKESLIFHDGRSLNLSESNDITAEAPTQIIILAGASASGKTTLLASVYEKFSGGAMTRYSFAGSKTLPGFEERCHLARIASDRITPDTERTKASDEIQLLHLKVTKTKGNEESINILISDLSGETFRIIKDSSEECKKMKLLSRADHFTILMDGKQLSNKKLRQKTLADCRSLLRSCLDARMLGKHTFVEIVFSKWDLVEPNKKENENTNFVENVVKTSILREFDKSFGKLKFYKVASRPEKNVRYPFGFNLDDVFDEWASQTPDRVALSAHQEIQIEKFDGIDTFSANQSG